MGSAFVTGNQARLYFLLLAMLIGGCDDLSLFGDCGVEIQSEQQSPGGAITATTLVRNCGATTDFSTTVVLHSTTEPFDSEDADEVLLLEGRRRVVVRWASDSELQLAFNRSAVIRSNCERPDVRIQCGP